MSKEKKEYYTTPQGAEQLKAWAADGFSQKEIAAKAGISARTLLRWRQSLPQIAEALRTGEARGDTQVESRLFEAAMGSSYTEQQAYKLKSVYYDENGHRREEERVEIVEVQKQRPPSTTAQMFWLKNRCPGRWSASPEAEDEEESSIEVRIV